MQTRILAAMLFLFLLLPGCAPKVKLFASPATEPLQEFVLRGEGDGKVALIYLKGFLVDQPRSGLIRTTPSQVQELVSNLTLAEMDEEVGAVVVSVDSPGGTITASDILYHEISSFKKRTGKKVVVAMFDVAASGGYYVSLPADWIMAHPTTVTGSVGVIFMRPKLHTLLDKVGVQVEVSKSGKDKDMGSPFRPTTEEEKQLFQNFIHDYASRFHGLVAKHRKLDPAAMETVKTARVFTAYQAKKLGLVDGIGYLDDAFIKARELAGMDKDAKVVAYRRDVYPNDNPYNNLNSVKPSNINLLGVDTSYIMPPKAGFYYLWTPGVTN